jgi:hypothetical protein
MIASKGLKKCGNDQAKSRDQINGTEGERIL